MAEDLKEQRAIVDDLCRCRDAERTRFGQLQRELVDKRSRLEAELFRGFEDGLALDREIDEGDRELRLRRIRHNVLVARVQIAGEKLADMQAASEQTENIQLQQRIGDVKNQLRARDRSVSLETLQAQLAEAESKLDRLRATGAIGRQQKWLGEIIGRNDKIL